MTRKCDQCDKIIKGKALTFKFQTTPKFYLCSKECYKKKYSFEMRLVVMFDMG